MAHRHESLLIAVHPLSLKHFALLWMDAIPNTALRLHIILRLTDSQNVLITRSLTCSHVTLTNRTLIGIVCCCLSRTHITSRVKRRTDFLHIALFTVATRLPRLIEFSRLCLLRILLYLLLITF